MTRPPKSAESPLTDSSGGGPHNHRAFPAQHTTLPSTSQAVSNMSNLPKHQGSPRISQDRYSMPSPEVQALRNEISPDSPGPNTDQFSLTVRDLHHSDESNQIIAAGELSQWKRMNRDLPEGLSDVHAPQPATMGDAVQQVAPRPSPKSSSTIRKPDGPFTSSAPTSGIGSVSAQPDAEVPKMTINTPQGPRTFVSYTPGPPSDTSDDVTDTEAMEDLLNPDVPKMTINTPQGPRTFVSVRPRPPRNESRGSTPARGTAPLRPLIMRRPPGGFQPIVARRVRVFQDSPYSYEPVDERWNEYIESPSRSVPDGVRVAPSPSSSPDPLAGQQAATLSPHSPSDSFLDSSTPIQDRSKELEAEPALPPGSLSGPRTKISQSIQRPVKPRPRSK
ncbi:hypothetical protein A1Q1_03944 [Trichosporon asahii var. asahii CBS 2479]|uniref:Uncharacterized protein n=1 Tax=Trichosporon asahii var. asahii (strain ATCC 90039 / CBS 2479 / JCM 2466 / KCTC 7840 / NBRC 103889/ NCYC 2677 / UAMH 7654) TaxID=1186058 RepID=J4U9J8_TRIAS|nr:hypothetical protein A1Q1_03944 [Trichosporon asahii var. asahii CBS 2479]EJT47315.1 hypothetical protein A1Q1_03944 [Trichosporon asahii var. asahii CBS 2479]